LAGCRTAEQKKAVSRRFVLQRAEQRRRPVPQNYPPGASPVPVVEREIASPKCIGKRPSFGAADLLTRGDPERVSVQNLT
jgi:hypothetical protein